jgi:uncharacterized protein
VIYLSHRIRDKGDLRATFSALFFTEGLTRIISFWWRAADDQVWMAYIVALPGAGRAVSGRARACEPEPEQMTRLVGGLAYPACLLVSSLEVYDPCYSRRK